MAGFFSCPLSVSFIFKKVNHNDVTKSGSVGVGCTIDKKVQVAITPESKAAIFFNDKQINFPTVKMAVDTLSPQPLTVKIKSPLPLGCGFGVSAASTLAVLFAINRLFNLKKTRLELSRIAHKSEILNHTGLGSIATQITGGFLLKKQAGVPGSSVSFPFIGQQIYATLIAKLETPSIISSAKILRRVNKAADIALRKIRENTNLNFADILDYSLEFDGNSELLNDKRVKSLISSIKKQGGHACMLILGHAVVSDIMPKGKLPYKTYKLAVSDYKI